MIVGNLFRSTLMNAAARYGDLWRPAVEQCGQRRVSNHVLSLSPAPTVKVLQGALAQRPCRNATHA